MKTIVGSFTPFAKYVLPLAAHSVRVPLYFRPDHLLIYRIVTITLRTLHTFIYKHCPFHDMAAFFYFGTHAAFSHCAFLPGAVIFSVTDSWQGKKQTRSQGLFIHLFRTKCPCQLPGLDGV